MLAQKYNLGTPVSWTYFEAGTSLSLPHVPPPTSPRPPLTRTLVSWIYIYMHMYICMYLALLRTSPS